MKKSLSNLATQITWLLEQFGQKPPSSGSTVSRFFVTAIHEITVIILRGTTFRYRLLERDCEIRPVLEVYLSPLCKHGGREMDFNARDDLGYWAIASIIFHQWRPRASFLGRFACLVEPAKIQFYTKGIDFLLWKWQWTLCGFGGILMIEISEVLSWPFSPNYFENLGRFKCGSAIFYQEWETCTILNGYWLKLLVSNASPLKVMPQVQVKQRIQWQLLVWYSDPFV
jgi:hypothetical protein